MSFLKNIFGSTENQNNTQPEIDWIPLTDLDQLGEIIFNSNEKPAIIFKHSTRCSVSRMALRQFENDFKLSNKVTAYFLDLISYREISNEIATRFEVIHESPQILLIKDGRAVYTASHSDIIADDLVSLV